MDKTKKMRRSTEDKVFLGVIGGIAEYFGVDSVAMRVLFIFFVLITGVFPLVIGYFIAAMVMPVESGRMAHEVRKDE